MAGTQSIRTAVCQTLVIDGDREGNFRRIEYALESARAEGAVLATFPESAILGWQNPESHELAFTVPGPDSDQIADLACRYGLMISIGLEEKDGDSLYGAAILVDRQGNLLWKHRKLNVLADLMEPSYAEGQPDAIGVACTEFGRIGTVICADTFDDGYAARIAELSPDLMLVPYGWAAETYEWPEHACELEKVVVGRARLWRCPVIGTDLVGVMMHGPWRGKTYGGASLVVNGAGEVVARLRDRDVECRVLDVPVGRN